MAGTEQDLLSFTSYVRQKIGTGHHDLTIDELFDQWRAEDPSDELYAENVAAINASTEDFRDGERGTPAGEDSSQLRRTYGVEE